MSERMTDADVGLYRTAAWARGSQAQRREAAERLSAELDRARSEEECLTNALTEKDAQIKALADALVGSASLFSVANGPCWGCHSPVPADENDHRDDCRSRRAALRLVGRLP